MPNLKDDDHVIRETHAISDTVGRADDFAKIGLATFRHDAPALREVSQGSAVEMRIMPTRSAASGVSLAI
jgi:hypothetical protein